MQLRKVLGRSGRHRNIKYRPSIILYVGTIVFILFLICILNKQSIRKLGNTMRVYIDYRYNINVVH